MAVGLQSADLVGRDEERSWLRRSIDAVQHRHGGFVLLRGEAGIGKSRLLAEIRQTAMNAGLATLSGRAVEDSSGYRAIADALISGDRELGLPDPVVAGPFAGALGQLVPGWGPAPTRTPLLDMPLLVSEGLLRLLAAIGATDGVLLLLDDVHWADVDTLSVLSRLADAVDTTPVLVVAAARHESNSALDRLAASPAVTTHDLQRLDHRDAERLAEGCTGGSSLPPDVLSHIADRADGLPFLVVELIRALVDTGALTHTAAGWEVRSDLSGHVPTSFAALVRDKVSTLDEASREVVDTAAVIGREIDWQLLAPITGRSEPVVLGALRIAVDRGLLVPDPGQPNDFRFVHALTRDAVLASVLVPTQRAVAAAAARVVEDRGQDPELAATLYARAGADVDAARMLLTTAGQTTADLRHREALLRRALDLAPDDVEIRAALLDVLVLAGRVDDALHTGEPMLSTLTGGDPRRAAVGRGLARAAITGSRWSAAQRYLASADTDGRSAADDALAAHIAYGLNRPLEAEQLAEQAAAATDVDPAVTCEALEMVGRCARARGRADAAHDAFSKAAEVAERHDLLPWRVRALHELGTLEMLAAAERQSLDRARELAVEAGMLSTAAVLDLQIAASLGSRMLHEEMGQVAARGYELARSLGMRVLSGSLLAFEGSADVWRGRSEVAATKLTAAAEMVQGDLDGEANIAFIRGLPALLKHDLPVLRSHLEDGMALVRRSSAPAPTPYRGKYALLETVLDDGAAARAELRDSGATVHLVNRGLLGYADAVAAGRRGDDPQPHLEAAERTMAVLTWRRHHARLIVAPAALADGWGSPVDWLREAMPHFAECGHANLARACRDLLRTEGVPVPRRGRGDTSVPPHLRACNVTSREMDVLLLVAAGASNGAIAQQLVLSPRTVETHVASLLTKTGATNRGELAKYVATSA